MNFINIWKWALRPFLLIAAAAPAFIAIRNAGGAISFLELFLVIFPPLALLLGLNEIIANYAAGRGGTSIPRLTRMIANAAAVSAALSLGLMAAANYEEIL